MGGGGDVVGALAAAAWCEALGTEARLGGVAWERVVIDPYPGPRPLAQIRGGRRLDGAVLADGETTTPEGVPFAESRMAAWRGEPVALLDVTRGPRGVAAGLQAAAREQRCDLAILVDVGGDVLARGDEPGLASPLCDAVMLASLDHLGGGLEALFGVVGAGCDGELTPAEVIQRVAALAAAGAWAGTFSVDPAVAAEIEAAAAEIPTEASLQIARCARGEVGRATIRAGRRSLELSPLGALGFLFHPGLALASEALPLARAVIDADSIEAARDRLAVLGIRTELDYERERVAELSTANVPEPPA
jgi:hypothetical protein